ncbi:MAG: ABC transporter permease [Gemmatimonadota bacterium]
MSSLLQDIKFGVRSLTKSPIFSLVAIVTLGVGIGATTAIFSLVNSVVLRPLSYPNADELITVWRVTNSTSQFSTSYPDFRDWREQVTSFAALGAHTEVSYVFRRDVGADELYGEGVSVDVLPLLGVTPHIGRWFSEEEDVIGGPDAIILGYSMWRDRYGADSTLIGKTILLSENQFTVVGVMPRGFHFPTPDALYWVPLRGDEILREAGIENPGRTIGFLNVVGRLKRGVDLATASREIESITARIDEAENTRWRGVNLIGLREVLVGDVSGALFTFFGAVALVLLIACANVANLYLVRSSARRREIAVRAALGAGRRRLVRQLLTESTVLAIAGGAVGVIVALWATSAAVSLAGDSIPRAHEIAVDPAALAFTAIVAVIAGLLFGVVPALQLSSRGVSPAINEIARGSTGGRRSRGFQQGLVIAQIALALVLLTGAGLLMNSFIRLMAVDPGFEAEGALTARVSLPRERYATDEATLAYFDEVVERLSALPGVTRVATSYSIPFAQNNFILSFLLEGEEEPPRKEERQWAGTVLVGEGYFEAAGVRMLRGRGFDRRDRYGPEVVVINETMARRYWAGEDPIGKRFRTTGGLSGSVESLESRFYQREWMTVVGVAGDVRRRSLNEPAMPEFYRLHAQMAWPGGAFIVRAENRPEELIALMRREIWAVDPAVPIEQVGTMRQLINRSVAAPRFRTLLLSTFAAVAGFLAVLGVYGVMAFAVAQRKREIGIRMALGAPSQRVLGEILGRGMRLTAYGVAVGIIGALIGTRTLSAMVYGISAYDPFTYAGVAVALALVAAIACYIPALRASRVDPVITLREE